MSIIKIIRADITSLEVDAIVNAANESLLGGGGVDGAIHRAAGPRLLAFNKTLGGCPTGEARISPGFNLPSKWVIHTVGPVWQGGGQGESQKLHSCYENCFILASQERIQSIAFPAISTGVYGFPREEAAEIALSVMQKHAEEMQQVVACCFSEEDVEIMQRIYQTIVPDRGTI